ncbi:hypothetical protein ATK74_0811 [Propionicimonas paludicola]|uniref:Uncharacterized protein n=1 Tax=Propionicimonas paludicola TaxID=185243 RepID=A0A2A9CP91_9ACTN|nr:hypothetical protein [Propionicimonas paludicola]PFG16277.1 hypothetical protein ATK74_0811 [Propionicimonas paludicola]
MTGIQFPDLELQLGPVLRARLASFEPLVVSREFPAPGWAPGQPVEGADSSFRPRFWIVIRDDGGPELMVTAQPRLGFNVIGAAYDETGDLARRLAALLQALPELCLLPIADATVRSPYSLGATDRAEFYLTAELVVVGRPVNL